MKTAHWTLSTAFAIALLSTVSPASAVLLPYATMTSTPGTSYNARPELGGYVLFDVSHDIICGSTVMGTIQESPLVRVNTGTTNGHIDFYYRIFLNEGAPDLLWFGVNDFQESSYIDVDTRTDSLGTESTNVAWSDGTDVSINFNGYFNGGKSSHFFFIGTGTTSAPEQNITGRFWFNGLPTCYAYDMYSPN